MKDAPKKAKKKPGRMIHMYCACDPSRALCGRPIKEHLPSSAVNDCVVCADLATSICPTCGARG